MDTDKYEIDYKRYTCLFEHCKYLYEEEKDRRDVLNNTSKIYMAAQIFILSILGAKVIGANVAYTFFDSLELYYNSHPVVGLTIYIIILFSSFLFLLSFVLAI